MPSVAASDRPATPEPPSLRLPTRRTRSTREPTTPRALHVPPGPWPAIPLEASALSAREALREALLRAAPWSVPRTVPPVLSATISATVLGALPSGPWPPPALPPRGPLRLATLRLRRGASPSPASWPPAPVATSLTASSTAACAPCARLATEREVAAATDATRRAFLLARRRLAAATSPTCSCVSGTAASSALALRASAARATERPRRSLASRVLARFLPPAAPWADAPAGRLRPAAIG